MPQSLAQIYLHCVFSTKCRKPFLKNREMRRALHAYVVGILGNLDSPSLAVGGVEDHLHALIRLSRRITVAPDLLQDLKRDSSKWIKSEFKSLHDFHWQNGYGAF